MNKQNVAIFVDYDNIFIALNQYYRDFINPTLPYVAIQKIKEYYKQENVILLNMYADLQNIKISYSGFNILNETGANIQHVPKGKNSSDIILMIDAIKAMQQYPILDKIIIVSSDSDMTPLYKECKLHNKLIEIVYIEATISQDYLRILDLNNIPTMSIEKLLNMMVVNPACTIKELFGKITSDKEYLRSLMTQLNDIIKDVYEKYLKEDKYGNLISVGAVSLSSLSYHIKDRHIVPEYIAAKYDDHSLFVQMLVDFGVIVPVIYHTKHQEFQTWILSEKFLSQYSCSLPNLISEAYFQTVQ